MLTAEVFPVESEFSWSWKGRFGLILFFSPQMSQMSEAWHENGSGNFSSQEEGLQGVSLLLKLLQLISVVVVKKKKGRKKKGYFH